MTVKLTSLARGAGCGCKLPAAAVHPLVASLPAPTDPRVLVATSTADDAGVVRVRDDLALVQTVDFFTPIVDDPYLFGRIAAANALSDVYAMGAEPLSALNLVAFPLEDLGGETLGAILAGGHDAVAEAGASIVGGHSIDDPEPKYGLAVTGTVDPRDILTNAGGRPGDVLVLTKPLGVGAVTTAVKRGHVDGEDALLTLATATMAALNKDAAAAARTAGAHALTDVTGFGLLGHLHELALGSGCAVEVLGGSIPALEGALALLAGDEDVAVSGGSRRNRAYAEERFTEFAPEVPEAVRRLACDATTSGGLLAAVPPGVDTSFGTVVGHLHAGEPGQIAVR
ncbi:MAG TPA: selenide, water dikinase SelD [Solirubrobacteraceae bacterium]|nr:selenide, water dikinase SelD [Solirubrobacteraceae bacterium]